jgi:NAD(P)-dependent dehydrogenase (short-subunit alcohol dehydrogenase family)
MLALEAVRALLEHGASGISLFDLTPSFESAHAVSALASLRQTFPNAKILEKVVDITSEEAVNRGVDESVAELGSVDILLCFAGVVGAVHAAQLTVPHWRRMLDINTTGSWICAQAVGKCVSLSLFFLRILRPLSD